MMISPDTYIKQVKHKSFEELLEERDNLFAEIKRFEQTINYSVENEWTISPAPEVVYQCNLQYLAKLCELIQRKYNQVYVWGNKE